MEITKKKPCKLGILCFETAKIMSRLASIYRSLSDEEISTLRKEITKSKGITFLNSKDEKFLLSLACREMLEDLDREAAAVSRLGKKCSSDFGLNRFDLVYMNLKLGIIDYRNLGYGSRLNEKRLQKMERLISATSCLREALEALTELESSEQRRKQSKTQQMHWMKSNLDPSSEKIKSRREVVRRFQGISLWCKTFDRSVGLIARIVCVVYVRVCAVFGPCDPNLPSVSFQNIGCFRNQRDMPMIEPIKEQFLPHLAVASKASFVRVHKKKSDLFLNKQDDSFLSVENVSKNSVFNSAGPSTLGGSGLAARYANVILLAEKYLDPVKPMGHIDRKSLYQMLPENMKLLIRRKLNKSMKWAEYDFSLARGWREAVSEILRWLAPVARNTVKWQMQRSIEKTRFDSKTRVFLVQTLHFSDKEKTEAAIAEVLVGLSCIYRHENRRTFA